jgi:hypothetical protein
MNDVTPYRHNARWATLWLTVAVVPVAIRGLQARPAYPDSGQYHRVASIQLESTNADFLAVDSKHRRLYGAGNHIFDVDSLRDVGRMDPVAYGFALAPEIDRGITRRGDIFSLKTFDHLSKVDVQADVMGYDPATHRAFFLPDATEDTTIAVVDLASSRIVGQFRPTEEPRYRATAAVSDNTGRLFLNIWTVRDKTGPARFSVAIVDTRRLRTIATWPLESCWQPHGLAIDRQSRRLFISCLDHLLVLDTKSGRTVASLAVPGFADAYAYDERAHVLFSPSNKDTLTVIRQVSADVYRIEAQLPTQDESSAAVDEVTHRAFLYNRDGARHSMLLDVYAP